MVKSKVSWNLVYDGGQRLANNALFIRVSSSPSWAPPNTSPSWWRVKFRPSQGLIMQKQRTVYLVLSAATVFLGILSRNVELNSLLFNKYLGDALYAVLFYLLLGIVVPQPQATSRALMTSVFMVAVECFQMTGIPLEMHRQGGLVKLLAIPLGTKFAWYDLVAYIVGIAGITAADQVVIRRVPRN